MISTRSLGLIIMAIGAIIVFFTQALDIPGWTRGLFLAIGIFFMIEGYDNANGSFGPWTAR